MKKYCYKRNFKQEEMELREDGSLPRQLQLMNDVLGTWTRDSSEPCFLPP